MWQVYFPFGHLDTTVYLVYSKDMNNTAGTIKSIPVSKVRIGDTLWIGTGTSSTEAFVVGIQTDGDKFTFETTMKGYDWVYRIVKFREDRATVVR